MKYQWEKIEKEIDSSIGQISLLRQLMLWNSKNFFESRENIRDNISQIVANIEESRLEDDHYMKSVFQTECSNDLNHFLKNVIETTESFQPKNFKKQNLIEIEDIFEQEENMPIDNLDSNQVEDTSSGDYLIYKDIWFVLNQMCIHKDDCEDLQVIVTPVIDANGIRESGELINKKEILESVSSLARRFK